MKRILLLAVLGACGDDGGNTPVDGSIDHDAPIDTLPIDTAPANGEGHVFIAETPLIGIAVAMFEAGPLFPVVGTEGPCQGGGSDPATSLDAGTISITGTTQALTLTQDDPGDVYITPNGQAPADMFAPGATITVSATGGVVPAFTGTVLAPAKLTFVTPTSYSRAAPPTITWTTEGGVSTAKIWVLLASATSGASAAMLCRVPDTGSFALTTAQLALLPATVTQVTAVVYRVNETTVQAGSTSVALRAADGNSSPPAALAP